jgi:hypothetical protein
LAQNIARTTDMIGWTISICLSLTPIYVYFSIVCFVVLSFRRILFVNSLNYEPDCTIEVKHLNLIQGEKRKWKPWWKKKLKERQVYWLTALFVR